MKHAAFPKERSVPIPPIQRYMNKPNHKAGTELYSIFNAVVKCNPTAEN